MAHANHFLSEIAKDGRHQFKQDIVSTRVGGADQKGYDRYMGHLRQQERVIKKRQAQATGKVVSQQVQTYEEQIWMSAREHVKFNELPGEQRDQLAAERESMWAQIPAHLRNKANKLAGR